MAKPLDAETLARLIDIATHRYPPAGGITVWALKLARVIYESPEFAAHNEVMKREGARMLRDEVLSPDPADRDAEQEAYDHAEQWGTRPTRRS